MPQTVRDGLAKADELRSLRSRLFDEARDSLVTHLRDVSPPEWMLDRVGHLSRWRSPAKLASLARAWGNRRFDGDEQAFGALENWRYRDHHLWQWEASQRTKSLRRRREVYRVFAASMARQYGTVALERIDMRAFSKKAPVESAKEESAVARSQRHEAAISELRDCLAQCLARVDVPPAYTSMTCAECGLSEPWQDRSEMEHTCHGCGAVFDRDINAARNIMTIASGRATCETPGVARDSENEASAVPMGRFQRRRMAAGLAQNGGSREAVSDAAE
jgi:hypothetical protein